MSELVSKEYLSKQFTGYSQVVKGQLDKKINIEQGVDNKGKLLGVDDMGNVALVDAPDSVKVSSESDNQIEQKTDGIYVAPTDLSNYVEKVNGKNLSDNNLTVEMVEKIENTYTKNETYSRTEVDTAIANAQLSGGDVDLSTYATIEYTNAELAKKADATAIPDVSNFVEKENGKGLFSGSYNDLTDQPTIPSVDGLVSEETLNTTLADYVKSEDLPSGYDDTELVNRVSAIETNLGSHTVKSDVPENAVFTDTVYDDTALKTELTEAIATAKSEAIEAVLGETVSEDFDTLKEVADWIQSDTTSSAELITRVTNIENDYVKSADIEDFVTSSNLDDNYYTKSELYTQSELKVMIPTKISDLSNDSGFLTAHPTVSKSTDTTSTVTPAHGGAVTMVDSVTRDNNGHVTAINTKTVTLPSIPTASSTVLGGVKTTSTVTSNSGYTACPIISGVPYYKPSSGADATIYQNYKITYGGDNNVTTGGIKWGSNNAYNNTGSPAYVIGEYSASNAGGSFTTGYYTRADNAFCVVIGKYNTLSDTSLTGCQYVSWMNNNTSEIDSFIIGNGTQAGRGNAFRVTSAGKTYALSAFNSSGADYAEFVSEWADGNIENEDRVGYFVTLKDNKLYKANDGDYILGITSGNPSVVGNGDETYFWKYERDEFNRFIYEDKSILDEEGNEIINEETSEAYTAKSLVISEDYDPTQKYIARKDRPEWDYVGMTGVVPVRDDGTCVVNRYCKCGTDGIATIANEKGDFTYFVKERISDNIISVIIR